MPQESVNYAAGRLAMLRRGALDAAKLERLAGAEDEAEALRILNEWGYLPDGGSDWAAAADRQISEAVRTVSALTTDEALLRCFLIGNDAANLKLLLKARCQNRAAGQLSPNGVFPVEDLRHMVQERRYDRLPPVFQEAMEALEKSLLTGVDPMLIDVLLDRAAALWIQDSLKKSHSESARRYFSDKADFQNAITLLRLRRMGKDESFFMQVILPGGSLKDEEWREAWRAPDSLPGRMRRWSPAARDALRAALLSFSRLPALEKARDNELLSLYRSARNAASEDNVTAYLLQCFREAAAIRLVMTGKANGFSREAISERLRDLYG